MVDWQSLRDIYGSAGEIPGLLEAAASSTQWEAPVWEDLWQRLYHQGSVAPASYAALPRLAQIASERPDVAIDPSLFLFASIISSIDGPPEIATVRELYATEIADLVPVADHKLDLVSDRADVVYALQTVAALENLSPWQRWLEGPPNEEVELECPSCGDHVYLELVGGELVATIDPDDTTHGRPVQAERPGNLPAPEARLFDLCVSHGHADVAGWLLRLFGRVTCPHCEAEFHTASACA
ncbi:hypothetical protein [Cellulomonas composti]|nr:hypothetical protein [Cellulomonas composti]